MMRLGQTGASTRECGASAPDSAAGTSQVRRRRGESLDYVVAAIRANTQPPHTRGLGYVLDRHLRRRRVRCVGPSASAVGLGKFLFFNGTIRSHRGYALCRWCAVRCLVARGARGCARGVAFAWRALPVAAAMQRVREREREPAAGACSAAEPLRLPYLYSVRVQ